jgi:hypothetical protein
MPAGPLIVKRTYPLIEVMVMKTPSAVGFEVNTLPVTVPVHWTQLHPNPVDCGVTCIVDRLCGGCGGGRQLMFGPSASPHRHTCPTE